MQRVLAASKAASVKVLLNKRLVQKNTSVFQRQFSSTTDSFLSGSNAVYVDQMYKTWKESPSSVHASWNAYFTNLDAGMRSEESFVTLPSVGGSTGNKVSPIDTKSLGGGNIHHSKADMDSHSDSLGLSYLICAYQARGHEIANLDPLGLHAFRKETPPELDYKYHGFSDDDLDRKLNLTDRSTGGNAGFLNIMGSTRLDTTLRQVMTSLKKTYCSTLAVEYTHIPSQEKCNWIRSQIENPRWMKFSKEKRMHIHERLTYADQFEKYLANKFNTAKRFGLEGGESTIPGLKFMVDRGSELGIESFVLGMPHRGRLNVLANVMRKPMPTILTEFQGTNVSPETVKHNDDGTVHDWSSAGDVKYHLGTSADRTYPDGRKVHMALVANPSHLEVVNPVVIGKVRAKQYLSGNRPEDKLKHMPVLLHGDAAFAGQGVVYESLQMSRVPEFAVGGTLHVIVNNQVGFTTNPENGRSTLYASDIAKAFDVPVFHCNGDDPLAVVTAFETAVEYRQKFGDDCVIDIVCYRRYGHNELDQPMYTQPQMYTKIKNHPDTLSLYEQHLVDHGTCTKEDTDAVRTRVNEQFEKDYIASKEWVSPPSEWLSSKWSGFLSPRQRSRIRETGVPRAKLAEIGTKMSTVPDTVTPHKQLEKIISARLDTINKGTGIDWGTAEALAFGSLLLEGNHVRLTGQDVERGTFSHRHAVLVDQHTQDKYVPLNHLAKHSSATVALYKTMAPDMQAQLTVKNSILSELGVLGFEMGYSLENPNTLVLWEAQFGDFVNGAQIMIDQFISAGEDKWLRQSALTMLLPHGYMGQGAEHSSCRIERFLQQFDADEDVVPPMAENERMQIQRGNWQVVNCSTPANYFHVLRRQLHRDFRKPLIIATPKNLLRERRCTSTLDEMAEGTNFQRVLGEVDKSIVEQPEQVKRLIFCSGKVYYDLSEEREKRGTKDVAIVRIEQIAPFPFDRVAQHAALYKNADIMWVQEEPKNMGPWTFVQPRIGTATKVLNNKEQRPIYCGRKPAAATATGLGARAHNAEQNSILTTAFTL